jgi:hypothetical protein
LTGPASPPGVWAIPYPAGFIAGESPGQRNFDFTGTLPTRIFIGMWWRTSNPWQAQSVQDKVFYVTDVTGGGHGLYVARNGQAPNNLTITTQTDADNRNLPTVAQTPVSVGVWHRIELYLTWSTTGNGIAKLWLDGVLQIDRADVRWLNGTGFGRLHINPIWGGIGGIKLQNDVLEYDHVYVSAP